MRRVIINEEEINIMNGKLGLSKEKQGIIGLPDM